MGAAWMLHRWAERVRSLVPELHGHQAETLSLMAWSMCRSGTCHTTRMALTAPASAKIASTRRRFERFMANDRVNVAAGAVALTRSLLCDFAGQSIMLLVDETAMGPWLRCMKVSIGYGKRAMPLAWTCYTPGRLPITQPQIVELVLRQASLCLPRDARVILMADRGLSWPLLIDLCREFGWHYLLRVQEKTIVRLDGRCHEIGSLVERRGRSFFGGGEVFRKAGWRQSHIVAVWEPDAAEPWLLVTDLPACNKRCREYRRRMWQEESFRDEKSHGFDWHKSRVRDPAHADRLLLVMLLATWMTIAAGAELIRTGRRKLVEATSSTTLSIFQLGHRWWRYVGSTRSLRSPPLTLPTTMESVG